MKITLEFDAASIGRFLRTTAGVIGFVVLVIFRLLALPFVLVAGVWGKVQQVNENFPPRRDPKAPAMVVAAVLGVAGLTGCTSPMQYTKAPMQCLNERTRWAATENAGGFLLTVEYSQYQFIPVPAEVARGGRSELMFLAKQFADGKGRQIKPVQEADIRESSGRNGLSGVSSWSGQAQVNYAP